MNWAVLEPLERYLRQYHGLGVQDVTPTDSPGYWEVNEECGGRDGGCSHPLHGTLFNNGGCRHTINYRDQPKAGARFVNPYRTWRAHREITGHSKD